MATYLDRILDDHRAAAAADTRPCEVLAERAATAPPARGFRAALRSANELSVIAEIKRRSPSRGDLNAGLDPALLASTYETGGAACLSVLTDGRWFGGSPEDLGVARAACSLPVLRKDFTVSERDVYDARIMGADAVLLIVAALDNDELIALHGLAVDVGLDVLVEVHDEPELERALAIDAAMVGVNQRDLVTFAVDPDRAVRLVAAIPDHVVAVAESGVTRAADVAGLAAAGYDAVLVGEHLVTSADPAAAVAALRVAGAEGISACS